MMDFPNIPEILNFLLANLRILDKSMISGRFPYAKPLESTFFREELFPETRKKQFRGKVPRGKFSRGKVSREMFLGENVSGGEGLRSVWIVQISRNLTGYPGNDGFSKYSRNL